jgi:hypothetical protein
MNVDDLLKKSSNGQLTKDQLIEIVSNDLKSRATGKRMSMSTTTTTTITTPAPIFELSNQNSIQSNLKSISFDSIESISISEPPMKIAAVKLDIFDGETKINAELTPISNSNRLGAIVTGATKVQMIDVRARRRIGKAWQSPHVARIERVALVDNAARLLVTQDVDGIVAVSRIGCDCRVRADSTVQFRELASMSIWHIDVDADLLAVCVAQSVKVFDLLTPSIRSKWTIKCHQLDAAAIAPNRRLIVALRDESSPRTTLLRCFQLSVAAEPTTVVVGNDIQVQSIRIQSPSHAQILVSNQWQTINL